MMTSLRAAMSIEPLNPMGHDYLPGFLGVEILELKAGSLSRRMPVKKRHFAPNDCRHAASIVALADTTCGYATLAPLPDGAQSFTTIELKSNYLGTVRDGGIACLATAQPLG